MAQDRLEKNKTPCEACRKANKYKANVWDGVLVWLLVGVVLGALLSFFAYQKLIEKPVKFAVWQIMNATDLIVSNKLENASVLIYKDKKWYYEGEELKYIEKMKRGGKKNGRE